jgi:hypothetical protein
MGRPPLILFAIALTGCSTESIRSYEGPQKSSAEVSTIRTWGPTGGGAIFVNKIDGKEVGPRVSHVHVLPGEHVVNVRFVATSGLRVHNTPQSVDLKAITKAGHSYIVVARPDYEAERVGFRIEDKGPNYDPECLIPRPFEASVLRGRNC